VDAHRCNEYTPLTWTPVDPQKIYHIVYGIPGASLANASALTKQNNAGLVFLTLASLASNPYGSLPSFFAQEVTDASAGGPTDSTVPTAPVVANGSNGGTYATLSWTPSTDANGSGVVGYDAYQNGVKVKSVPASTAPQVTITGLLPATTYAFTVAARNVAGTTSAVSTHRCQERGVSGIQLDRHYR
jgi:hypothetical protein